MVMATTNDRSRKHEDLDAKLAAEYYDLQALEEFNEAVRDIILGMAVSFGVIVVTLVGLVVAFKIIALIMGV